MTQEKSIAETVMFPWCPELGTLYSSSTVVGRSGKVFQNKGSLSTPNNIKMLRAVIMDTKPRRTLEVGLAFGGSALTIATCHKEVGHTDTQSHTAIDLAQSSYWDNAADDALERAGLRCLVRTIEQPSSIALAALHEKGETFDFCYVDGSHQFEDVFVDFYFIARMLNTDGVVLFDDASDPHIAKVLNFIRRNYRDVFEEIDLTRYLHGPQQKLRRSLAHALGRVQLIGYLKKQNKNASLHFKNF